MTLGIALRLGRVSNLPTVISNVLAAIALSGAVPHPLAVVAICFAIALMYVAGMFLNDAFDREVDAIERPERPIPSGQISAAEVFGAGFALLGGGVLVVAGTVATVGASWLALASACALAGLIVYYDLSHKTNPLAPLVMGLCRVGAYTTAALAAGGSIDRSLLVGCGLLLAYLIGLTAAARRENVRFSLAPRKVSAADLFSIATLALPLIALHPIGRGPWAFAVYLMFAGWTVRCVRLVLRGTMREAVGGLIAGISLLDAVFAIRCDRPVLAAAACVAFVLTTRLQRRIAGT